MNIIFEYLFLLIATIFIEFLVLFLFLKKKPLQILFYSILINSFSLPLATYFYQNLLSNFILTEIIVFLIESVLLMKLLNLKYSKAFLMSLTANLITSLISLILRSLPK